MDEALRQARKAAAKGEVPVGAVLVVNGAIVTRAHNQVEELKDATAHAEMLVVTAAAGGALNLLQFEGLNHKCEIRSGVRAEECREILREFFQERRKEGSANGES